MKVFGGLLILLVGLVTCLHAFGGISGGTLIPMRKFPKESTQLGAHWGASGSFGVQTWLTEKLRSDQLLALSESEINARMLSAPNLNYNRYYFRMREAERQRWGIGDGKAVVNGFTYVSHYASSGMTVGSADFAWCILNPSMGWGLYQFVFDEDGDFQTVGNNTLTELGDENKDLNFGYTIGLSTDFLWKRQLRFTLGAEMHVIFKSISMLYVPAPLIADITGDRPRVRFFNLYVGVGWQ